MKLPIILDENGDISMYNTIEDLEQDLEAVDVHNNEYVVYDANGHLLKLETKVQEKKSFFGKVFLEHVILNPNFCKPGYEDQLYRKLDSVLRQFGELVDKSPKRSLDSMIKKVSDKIAER